MSWKIRHEGSPRSIDGLTLQQVVEGIQEGQWEVTDEIMGPGDQRWTAIETHPKFAEAVAEVESHQQTRHGEGTHLDMNPLIDVALVLLIFFMLTTTYETIRKALEMPDVSAEKVDKELKVVKIEQIQAVMIRVDARKQGGKSVILLEDKPIDEKLLMTALRRFVRDTHKTQILINASDDVEWGTVVLIQDAAKGAGINQAYFQVQQPAEKGPAPE